MVGRNLWTRYDWNFSTTQQTFLDNVTRQYNAGHVVGGSSILNGLVWTRGSAADFDAWEALGNRGWGWKALLPYFMKVRYLPLHEAFESRSSADYYLRARHSRQLPTITSVIRICPSMASKVQSKSASLDFSITSLVRCISLYYYYALC